MKKKKNMGYCNCYTEKIRYLKRTKDFVFENVRDAYKQVRVDNKGLCFLCASVAMCSEPEVKEDPRLVKFAKQFHPDLSVSKENPEGIFMVREDESDNYVPYLEKKTDKVLTKQGRIYQLRSKYGE